MAERALDEGESPVDPQLLAPLLASVSDAILAVHATGVIEYVNPAAEALVGVGSSDAVGRPVFTVAHLVDDGHDTPAEDLDALVRCVRQAHAEQRRIGLMTGNDVVKPVSASLVGGAAGFVLVLREAAESDRMAALGTLAAGAAHEINNPLTYLLIDLEHVLRRLRASSANPPGEQSAVHEETSALVQCMTRAMDGARRVQKIVRDLTTFSQGDIAHRGLVDVRGVLESAVQMAWYDLRHRARLVKSLAEVPPIEANESRLAQVFLTLLINAAQAIPEGHADRNEVRVSTRVDEDGQVVVEVADTGTGIASDALPRIFDPFFTTKTAKGGTGLGLSVAHGIVKSLGGELRVSSTPGQGSTFRVVLGAARAYRHVSSRPVRAASARRRILVIEDEPLVRAALAQSLADEVSVTAVADAKEALALIAATDCASSQPASGRSPARPSGARGDGFDLILCDLMMPVMTGVDFYVELLRVAPHLAGRIVFMTGGVFTARARSFLESVNNPCLEKPIDMSKLRSLLARS
jgi:PAS domain S-box-containing protein